MRTTDLDRVPWPISHVRVVYPMGHPAGPPYDWAKEDEPPVSAGN